MDTHATVLQSNPIYTMALPGEEPGEAVAASAATPSNGPAAQSPNSTPNTTTSPDKPAKPSLVRGWWTVTSPRTKLLAGVAIVAVAALGGYGIYASQPRSSAFDVVAEPGYAPSRDVQSQVAALGEPGPQRPVIPTRETSIPAVDIAPPATPPAALPVPVAAAPVIPVPEVQPAPPAEDPQIADMRRLMREAATAPNVVAPRVDPEKAQMAAMVTALSGITRESLEQQVQMRKQLTQAIADLQTEVADLKQRLTFSEARAGFQAAVGAAGADPRGGSPRAAAAPAAAAPPARAAGPAPQYRISAASTGMAALTITNAAAGQTDKVEVFVGDVLQGYGKVLKIEQKGTAWQLVAEQGVVGQ